MTDGEPQEGLHNPIDALFEAMAQGDVAAAREPLHPDAQIWHCFDRISMDVDALLAQWQDLITTSEARYVTDVRRQATGDGYVQQHTFVIEQANGGRMAWPVCIVVRLVEGKIARLDEYIDRAAHFCPRD